MSRVPRAAAALLLSLYAGSLLALDPTQPPRALAPAAADRQAPVALRLQAVLRGPRSTHAIINGQSLKVGETFADARVLAIHSHSVLIDRAGQQQLLRLAAPVITPSRTQP